MILKEPSKRSITEGSQAGEGQREGSREHLQKWVTDEQEPRVYSSSLRTGAACGQPIRMGAGPWVEAQRLQTDLRPDCGSDGHTFQIKRQDGQLGCFHVPDTVNSAGPIEEGGSWDKQRM